MCVHVGYSRLCMETHMIALHYRACWFVVCVAILREVLLGRFPKDAAIMPDNKGRLPSGSFLLKGGGATSYYHLFTAKCSRVQVSPRVTVSLK